MKLQIINTNVNESKKKNMKSIKTKSTTRKERKELATNVLKVFTSWREERKKENRWTDSLSSRQPSADKQPVARPSKTVLVNCNEWRLPKTGHICYGSFFIGHMPTFSKTSQVQDNTAFLYTSLLSPLTFAFCFSIVLKPTPPNPALKLRRWVDNL